MSSPKKGKRERLTVYDLYLRADEMFLSSAAMVARAKIRRWTV
jgi:hypothetical protein